MLEDIDLFYLFRRLLLIVVSSYAAVRLYVQARRLLAWYRARDPHVLLLRDYTLFLLRGVRLRPFAAELALIAALSLLLLVVITAHHRVGFFIMRST